MISPKKPKTSLIPKPRIRNFQNVNIIQVEKLVARDFVSQTTQLKMHIEDMHETNKSHAYNRVPPPRRSSDIRNIPKLRKIPNLISLIPGVAGGIIC